MPQAGRYLLLPLKSRDDFVRLAQEFAASLEIELLESGAVLIPGVNAPTAADLWFAEFKRGPRNPFTYPVTGRIGDRRGTPFSPVHTGVDFAIACGVQLVALREGVVYRAGMASDGLTGNFVTIEYSDGTFWTWAHLSRVAVTAGMRVQPADWIGNVGTTGASTGCHLHLEGHRGPGNLGTMNNIVDPFQYFTELQ